MLKALGTKLILERIDREQTSPGGLVLTNLQDPNPLARVLSTGDQVKLPVKEGDTVVVSWSNTAQQKYENKTYYIADETAIFAMENPND